MSRIAQSSRSIQYRHRRSGGRFQLNLVAMMDVFTILVFFFLAHSSDFSSAANDASVSLPESLANQKPRDTVVVTITPSHILVQGKTVADAVASLEAAEQDIGSLREALLKVRSGLEQKASADGRYTADARAEDVLNNDLEAEDRTTDDRALIASEEITIMSDKSIPFRLLKKVMLTTTRAGYDRISLSVLQRSTQSGAQ